MDVNGDARAHLYARGDDAAERVVTAGDVVWPAEVDVINPEQVIATIDSVDGVIDMDLWITQDRGYKPAELQESYSIGEIPIDAIYTPIERVNFVVEHTRVGPMTDYDRLIIEVLTDGTIEPDEALAEAARILVSQAQVFAGLDQAETTQAASPGVEISEEAQNKLLSELGLSPRVLNALRSRQIERVGQVLQILAVDPEQLLSIRNFGPRSLTELKQKLVEHNYLAENDASLLGGDFGDELELGEDLLDDFGGDLLAELDEERQPAGATAGEEG
jgi:DNA-directed RNA polymerase subunit alpha